MNNPEHGARIILALEQLLYDYSIDHNQMDGETLCCLCATMTVIADETGNSRCEFCPWMTFTGKTCGANFLLFIGPQYDRSDRQWISQRLEQLPYWISSYRDYYAAMQLT